MTSKLSSETITVEEHALRAGPETLPTVEEHAARAGLKRFARALLFAYKGYAQGQRVSAKAFDADLAEALSLPLRSGGRKGR
jgi:hypothetical protein